MNAVAPIRDNARALVDEIAPDLQAALPSTIPLERFKATFITAVAHNPDILTCEPQSVKTALMKAAIDNLMPDNREAAIVPFNTKVKGDDGRDKWVKLAQYMPMVQGIRKRALELGGARISAECVYENDHFDAVLGDDPHLEHKPARLGLPRGEIIGAYAIFKDDAGTILHRELMAKDEIESARNVSKAKDGPGWRNFYGEFARKTVVRRGAKSIPNIPDKLRAIIERDDDYVDFEQVDSRQKSVDHNPLIEGGTRQIESRSIAPMERIDSETGEVIETKSEAQFASPDKQTMGGRKGDEPGASAKPSSSEDGAAGNATGNRSQNTRSPSSDGSEQRASNAQVGGSSPSASTSSPAASSSLSAGDKALEGDGSTSSSSLPGSSGATLSRDVFQNFSGALARMQTEENVTKAKDAWFKENKVKPNAKELDLFKNITQAHVDRAKSKMDVGKVMNEVEGWICEDVPEETL